MTKYTIAERQELKCKLADEKYFEKDRLLFGHLYPHHVLNDECKRVNKMNKAGLHSRMLYILLQAIRHICLDVFHSVQRSC